MGLIEECVGVDQKMLQEVIIPLMNVSRRCMDGTTQESEVLNQSQLYINKIVSLLREEQKKICLTAGKSH